MLSWYWHHAAGVPLLHGAEKDCLANENHDSGDLW